MKKPLWENAPVWANFLAQDKDGLWFWYEIRPQVFDNIWDSVYGKAEQVKPDDADKWYESLEDKSTTFVVPDPVEIIPRTEIDMENVARNHAGMEKSAAELEIILKQAPAWATHLAQDSDGDWFAYDARPESPTKEDGNWYIGPGNFFTNCKYLGKTTLFADWDTTLLIRHPEDADLPK